MKAKDTPIKSQQADDQNSDEELLALYCHGNNRAFDMLYNRHRDSLYRFLLRQNNNMTAQAEEIFQEVWFSIINHKKQFRNDSKFSTWLYQIARNKLTDSSRKSLSRKEKLHDDIASQSVESATPEPDHKTQLQICIELLQGFVLQLPQEQKEAFVLKHDTDKSIDDLALITNTTHETFKSRLRYAMQKLRDWLPGECL
ncbi:MAG: sigma-70 family RNA polymerase sigma factor [Gammaproteobacteria bacterium]|nr:sigma-70 family RNA polymerase sigma factor [Gammaproteobacteria bacterium]